MQKLKTARCLIGSGLAAALVILAPVHLAHAVEPTASAQAAEQSARLGLASARWGDHWLELTTGAMSMRFELRGGALVPVALRSGSGGALSFVEGNM